MNWSPSTNYFSNFSVIQFGFEPAWNHRLYAGVALHKLTFNPFKPEFTIVIFTHYKPRLVVDEDDLMWVIN